MAAVRSLGLHEPSALAYLISESLLPIDPPESLYQFKQQHAFENGAFVTDEVLTVPTCAVWSRNGTIKRVFNLDVEGESILHAFVTRFALSMNGDQMSTALDGSTPNLEPALVAVLRTQAHIFQLSGDTHVLPLTFEVQSALPSAFGFVFQRNIDQGTELDTSVNHDTKKQFPRGVSVQEESLTNVPGLSLHAAQSDLNSMQLPRTYSFTNILSELGLVVASPNRKVEALADCHALSRHEDLIYISTSNEVQTSSSNQLKPVYLAVTVNDKLSTLTLWHVVFEQSSEESQSPKPKIPEKTTHRQSSNTYPRQTATTISASRITGTFRESFGGLNKSVLENLPLQPEHDQASKFTDDFAAHLGHEFEQAGIQTRSSRRVSSMLARTDLGGANERSAFNDLSLGIAGRKSLSRSIRRGESMGGFSDRQSFGRRRSSFQTANSMISDTASFLDVSPTQVHDEHSSSKGVGEHEFEHGLSSNLPRVLGFMKLRSVPHKASPHTIANQQQYEVATMLAPDRSTADDRRSRILSVCIMDRAGQEMITINLALKASLMSSHARGSLRSYDMKAIESQHRAGIVDAHLITQGSVQRLLTLTRTRDGLNLIHLEAPWSPPFRLTLPRHYNVFDHTAAAQVASPNKTRDTGVHRVIAAEEINLIGFRGCESEQQILLVDQDRRNHRLHVQLQPSDAQVQKVLDMANFVLPPEQHDSFLVAWWEVKHWLVLQDLDRDLEWTSLTITIFLLAVPFLGNVQNKLPSTPRRRKDGGLRSSSGTIINLDHWNSMLNTEKSDFRNYSDESSAWAWMTLDTTENSETKSVPRQSILSAGDTASRSKKNMFLGQCVNLTREFLQSPAGETATGTEGYLPTAINKDRNVRRTALAYLLIGLHLLREEQKLDIANSSYLSDSSRDYGVLITQLATWLRWESWDGRPGTYYQNEVVNISCWPVEISYIETLEVPGQPFDPPSVFQYLEDIILLETATSFPSLLDLISNSRSLVSSHPLWKEASRLTPRLFALTSFMGDNQNSIKPRRILKQMMEAGIDDKLLASIPDGIATIFNHAIIRMRNTSPTTWPAKVHQTLDRHDVENDRQHIPKTGHAYHTHPHEAGHDYRTINNIAVEADSFSRWDMSLELDRQAVTKLIFSEDRRFQEASKLVNQTRPPIVQCHPEPGWSESDLLEAQKELAQHVTRRTLSVSAGRGMMHYNMRIPLLTERVPIPAFSLQCVMRAYNDTDNTQAMTFSADKAIFTEDKTSWAFFHNGASAGLMISRNATWIDTSWILYNKPPELTNRHAGFLLALGLNGHLKSLAKWVAFKYLTPKHTMISIGLLLGLAASYLGTMDTLVTRLLSVHVTRLLPPGAAELNLSPLTQTAGILGIGLLYHGSQHRRMSEVMLSEIENNEYEERSGDGPILRDEGYRLAAGFSLGLINLGQGTNLHGLHDMAVVERLLTIAIGTKNVNHVHVLDRATAGAVIAVAFVFMKTNNQAIASKIDIPDTLHQFDYVRPDIFLLRTLARHLIMWNKIVPTRSFIENSLPAAYRKRSELSSTKRMSTDDLPFFNIIAGICFAISLRFAGSHRFDVRDLLVAYLDQFLRLSKLPALNYDAKVTLNGIRNCLDIVALSCATVMAGSGDIVVLRRLRALHGRIDKETPFGSHLAAHMALGALFLSGGTATFGTSSLAIASLVMAFYPVFPIDVLDNKGHLQAFRHLWVLAVDTRCLITRDVESGQIIARTEALIEFMDGKKSTIRTPRLLPDLDEIRRIVFKHDGYWDVDVDLSAEISKGNTTVRNRYKQEGIGIQILLQRRAAYEGSGVSVFMSEFQALDGAHGVPSADPSARINEKWNHTHSHMTGQPKHQNPFSWVLNLDVFHELDHAAKALALGGLYTGNLSHHGNDRKMLRGTAVDSQLYFEMECIGLDHDNGNHVIDAGDTHPSSKKHLPDRMLSRDNLWQLRLLLAWTDRLEKEEQERQEKKSKKQADTTIEKEGHDTSWMKKEVIERLRWRIWKMADNNTSSSGGDEGETREGA